MAGQHRTRWENQCVVLTEENGEGGGLLGGEDSEQTAALDTVKKTNVLRVKKIKS